MKQDWEISVTNTFETETPEEALALFIEWIMDNAPHTGYRVLDEDGNQFFMDGDELKLEV